MKPKGHGFGLRRVVLVASLAANVLLVGAIVGFLLVGRDGPPRRFDPQMGTLGQVLTREQRIDIGRELRRAVRSAGIARPRRDALVTEIAAILAAENFDRAAFSDAMTNQYRNLDAVRDIALVTVSDYVAAMPVAERRALATTLQERSRQKGGPRGQDGPPPDRE